MRSAKLGTIAEIERSSVTPAEIQQGETYVGLEHISTDGRFVDVVSVNAGELQSNKFRFGPEHILYGKLRPYLSKIARPTFHGVCSTDILPIRPGPEVDRSYLTHVLRTPEMVAEATRLSQGANLPRLSPNSLMEFEIPLPPLEEQRRIASILDAADALRAKRRQALKRFDSLSQSIFIDMFGDPAVNPHGYKVIPLGDLCAKKGEYGAGVSSEPATPGKPRYLRITDIRSDGSLDEDRACPAGDPKEWMTKLVQPGDVLFARSGATVGKAFLARPDVEPMVFAGYLIRFHPDPARVAPEFLFAFTQTAAYRAWVAANSSVVAQPNLNAQKYASLPIVLPPRKSQADFGDLYSAIDVERGRASIQAVLLDRLVISLQHRAFRGEL